MPHQRHRNTILLFTLAAFLGACHGPARHNERPQPPPPTTVIDPAYPTAPTQAADTLLADSVQNAATDSLVALADSAGKLPAANVRTQPAPKPTGKSLLTKTPKGLKVSALNQQQDTVQNLAVRFSWQQNQFDAYLVNLNTSQVHLYRNQPNGQRLENIGQLLAQEPSLLFATNGGIFTPALEPEGLYIEKGRHEYTLNLAQNRRGNFYLQPNGVFFIDTMGQAGIMESQAFKKAFPVYKSLQYATQSGPMLVHKGALHPAFNKGSANRYIRSGVGIIDPQTVVFIISERPVNFYDFASVFKDYYGCQEALYLDGSISRTYLPGLNRKGLDGNFAVLIGVKNI